MNRFALASIAALASPWLTACAQAECATNFDCGIGNTCGGDGLCTFGGGAGTADVAVEVAMRDMVDAPALTSSEAGGATFDGSIGNARSSGPANLGTWTDVTGLNLLVSLPGMPSTFVLLVFEDSTQLEQPGRIVVAEPTSSELSGTYAQACNYDTQEYDEPLTDVVVDVGTTDVWGVTELLVSIEGERTDGAAVIPWSPPAPPVR